MTYKILLSFLLGMTLLLSACNFEDTYYAPCEGKYGSQKVIDSINSILKRGDAYFNNYYKNPDTIPTNCDTIRLQIIGDSIFDIVNAKAFVQTISKFFFNDTVNAHIKYLKLIVETIVPDVGKLEATYMLDRNSSINDNALNLPADTSYEYKIVDARSYASITPSGTNNGMRVAVNLHTEPKDLAQLAGEIKQQYINEIHLKNVDEFSVEFSVEKPNNKYCTRKWYSVYYLKENGEL